jgi:hypothetical protein
MAVSGGYMAMRVRNTGLRNVSAYGTYLQEEIVPVFENIEAKADAVAAAEYERLGAETVGEDWSGDMGDAAEVAQDKGLSFYQTLTGLRQSVLNLFAVGLFHLLEQETADLCRDASFQVEPPCDTKISDVADWYQDHFALDLHTLRSWSTIDELRLLANTTKHGEGGSAERLKQRRPELFRNPILRSVGSSDDRNAG